MFDIGWGELVVIGIVALIAIGPKELPGVLRSIGHWMGKIRGMAAEFQGQFQEAMREAEMSDLKKQVDDIGAVASNVGNFDPLASVQKEFESALEDKPAADPAPDAAAPPAPDLPPATPAPTVDVHVPLPEPLPPVSEKDFAPPEPIPPQQAGGGRPA
jgi:sec-independent protein translocase protein TatB